MYNSQEQITTKHLPATGDKYFYLKNSTIINWHHKTIITLSRKIQSNSSGELEYASKAFEYVRDNIKHSWDHQTNPVTCKASHVLKHQTGYCYAKSHLLAALLRAGSIPAGFCYQRLRLNEKENRHCLHGLNAVFLEDYGWYRLDARGNKEGVDAQFTPPIESLAFTANERLERDLPEIWPEPLPVVIAALHNYKTIGELYHNLPDIEMVGAQQK